jgi:hypothetical protein
MIEISSDSSREEGKNEKKQMFEKMMLNTVPRDDIGNEEENVEDFEKMLMEDSQHTPNEDIKCCKKQEYFVDFGCSSKNSMFKNGIYPLLPS